MAATPTEALDALGVHLLTFDPDQHQLYRWTDDTWAQWRERLPTNVLWFTVRTGPLALSEWDLMRT